MGGDVPAQSRRELLRALAVGGAALGAFGAPGTALARRKKKKPLAIKPEKGVIVYRFQVRGTRSCGACRRHHRYMIFQTTAVANLHRAHVGCNCPVETQKINTRAFRLLFPEGGPGVADLRKTPLRKGA
jgi:hypothetical protein